ncbi:MAG: hypothetical protein AB1635_00155 [Acidobacteriota bacterium]
MKPLVAAAVLALTASLAPAPLPGQAPTQAPAPPPATDIYLVPLANGLQSMRAATPVPVSTAAGYDNQPHFSADGTRLLFAANRDGRQIDLYAWDRAAGRVVQITHTPENENSPTYLPAGLGDAGGFSVVRTEANKAQRLWRFDAAGGNPHVVLPAIQPVGYHAWIDADRVALFVLGQPATLQLASVKTGKAEVVAEGIGRSLHRVPGTRRVSFVQRESSGEFWIKQIDLDTRAIDRLARAVEGSADRDMAWMPDGGTMLMASGTRVHAWTIGGSGWTEVYDAAAYGLGAVSRIAVAPTGDAIALVVAEPPR